MYYGITDAPSTDTVAKNSGDFTVTGKVCGGDLTKDAAAIAANVQAKTLYYVTDYEALQQGIANANGNQLALLGLMQYLKSVTLDSSAVTFNDGCAILTSAIPTTNLEAGKIVKYGFEVKVADNDFVTEGVVGEGKLALSVSTLASLNANSLNDLASFTVGEEAVNYDKPWCRLQWPVRETTSPVGTPVNYYMQTWWNGINENSKDNAIVQFGYGTSDNIDEWNWDNVAPGYSLEGSNGQYSIALSPAEGTYRVAARIKYAGYNSDAAYQYCDIDPDCVTDADHCHDANVDTSNDGSNDGFQLENAPKLIVNAVTNCTDSTACAPNTVNKVCDGVYCVECTEAHTEACDLGYCKADNTCVTVDCMDDGAAACPTGEYCNGVYCDIGCDEPKDCEGDDSKCDYADHSCKTTGVECDQSSDCAEGSYCDRNTNSCVSGGNCDTDDDCGSDVEDACNRSTHICERYCDDSDASVAPCPSGMECGDDNICVAQQQEQPHPALIFSRFVVGQTSNSKTNIKWANALELYNSGNTNIDLNNCSIAKGTTSLVGDGAPIGGWAQNSSASLPVLSPGSSWTLCHRNAIGSAPEGYQSDAGKRGGAISGCDAYYANSNAQLLGTSDTYSLSCLIDDASKVMDIVGGSNFLSDKSVKMRDCSITEGNTAASTTDWNAVGSSSAFDTTLNTTWNAESFGLGDHKAACNGTVGN